MARSRRGVLRLRPSRAGYPARGGGLWLRMILPAGLRAWLVPSGCTVSTQPSWCSMTWWCQVQKSLMFQRLVCPPSARCTTWCASHPDAGWSQPPGCWQVWSRSATRRRMWTGMSSVWPWFAFSTYPWEGWTTSTRKAETAAQGSIIRASERDLRRGRVGAHPARQRRQAGAAARWRVVARFKDDGCSGLPGWSPVCGRSGLPRWGAAVRVPSVRPAVRVRALRADARARRGTGRPSGRSLTVIAARPSARAGWGMTGMVGLATYARAVGSAQHATGAI
jgi:hypothetical protein